MVDIAESGQAGTRYLHSTLALVCAAILNEYRRAVAAEDYYTSLKRMSGSYHVRDGTAHGDIPRLVFEKFYSTHAE